MLGPSVAHAAMPQAGSIRGVVYDRDFGTPLSGAEVQVVGTLNRTLSTEQGNFVLTQLSAGTYTLVCAKDGYLRQVKADVTVGAGRLTDVDFSLSGEFTEMDEFIVQDIVPLSAASELGLLQLRLESAALLDSIGADLMSRAGASDAASALRLVAGASVQDGKFAVIRGLPDRYVSSQMNGVRLPTADEDKRAVELDQYPAAIIESIQVSKTFTPDQQGDASGGAVNVRLKGIPDESLVLFNAQVSHNSQAGGRSNFLGYDGDGVGTWGDGGHDRDIQYENLGGNWDGAVGVSREDAPVDFKLSTAVGKKYEFDDGIEIGGLASFFYERDSSFYDDGIDDSYWVDSPGDPLTPQYFQGTPTDGDFKTALFDVRQGRKSVQWGGLARLGLETENHSLGLSYLYTRTAEDTATLAEDTRGKAYFDPTNLNPDSAPFVRLETLEYT